MSGHAARPTATTSAKAAPASALRRVRAIASNPPRDCCQDERARVAHDRRRRWRRRVHQRARQRGGERDDRAHREQRRPDGVEGDLRGPIPHERQGRADEPDHRGDGREGHDREVRDEPGEGHLVEVPERNRQHGGLRAGAHRERAEDDVPRLGRDYDPRGRGERELEAGIVEIVGADGEDHERRGGEAVQHARLAFEEHRGQDDERHHHRPYDGGLRAHDRAETEHDDRRARRRGAATQADEPCEDEDGRGDERDVEAGDGEDVVDAGPAKAVVDLRGQPAALAEEEAAEQRRRRGGQRRVDRGQRAATNTLVPWGIRRVEGDQRLGLRGPRRKDAIPGEPRHVVEAAGIAESRWCAQSRLGADALADDEVGKAVAVGGQQ